MEARVSHWGLGLAVVLTAAITIWVMIRWGFAPDFTAPPPQFTSWSSVAAPWAVDAPADTPARRVPGTTVEPAAAVAALALLRAGARAVHADRGVCVNCHSIVSAQGTAVPAIHSGSPLLHEFRGVCQNCHQVALAGPNDLLAGGPPIGGLAQVRSPTEGEWLGMEVAPITALTASQFGLVPGTPGVVVTEAEAAAATAGFAPGDVITSIDGAPIGGMADFLIAPRAGALPRGAVEIRRGGQELWTRLSSPPTTTAAAPAAQATPGMAIAQDWTTGGAGPTPPGF